MPQRTRLNLDVDLQRGVVPISKAASSLAALIKRAHNSGQPVIVTQKGYPTGVLLPIELFAALKALADGAGAPEDAPLPSAPEALLPAPAASAAADDVAADAPKGRRPAARRRTRADAEPAEVGA